MAFAHEVRLALRGLRRSPGFAIVAVLILALGIGANTAIFSVLRAVVLRALPFPDAGTLVVIGESRRKGEVNTVSYADFVEWRADSRTLSELAAWHDEQLTLIGEGRPERLHAVAASANVFRTLRVEPALGRGFVDGEDRSGKSRVVVLAHAFWQRSFGVVPALPAAADPQDALRDAGGWASVGATRQRARSVLVAGEIAVAAVLLVGAGLMIKSFARLSRVEPGFVVDDLVTSSVFLPDARCPKERSLAFYRGLVAKLDALPSARGPPSASHCRFPTCDWA